MYLSSRFMQLNCNHKKKCKNQTAQILLQYIRHRLFSCRKPQRTGKTYFLDDFCFVLHNTSLQRIERRYWYGVSDLFYSENVHENWKTIWSILFKDLWNNYWNMSKENIAFFVSLVYINILQSLKRWKSLQKHIDRYNFFLEKTIHSIQMIQ